MSTASPSTTTPSKTSSSASAPHVIRDWRALYRRTVIENPFIPIVPTVAQAAFLSLATVLEVGYGGAAGGGKSAGLLTAGLQFVETPGYHALLLRRTFADLNLPDALIPLSHQWLHDTPAEWNEQKHQWVFPSTATLTFGYCENAQDIYRYQGPAFALVGWDELTQFPEFPYRYLFSRLRKRAGLPVPLRVRSGFNPGGIGHEWVKRRFIDEADGETRIFVSAKLEDNPYLDRPSYEESLSHLDPVTRAQLRHGDWDVRPEGNFFKRAWFGDPLEAPPRIKRVVRFWDLAGTEEGQQHHAGKSKDPDYTAGVKMGWGEDGRFYVLDVIHFRDTPHANRETVRQTAHADGRGVAVYMEQEPGQSGKDQVESYRRDVLPGFEFYGVRASGDKVTRARAFSAAAQAGMVRLVRGNWIGKWLDELGVFPMAGAHDDQVDASAGAHQALTGGFEEWTEADLKRAFDGKPERLEGPDKPMSQREKLLRELRGGKPLELMESEDY